MKNGFKLFGRNIIFINSGGKKKRFTLEKAKRLGATIILVNNKLDCNKNLVDYFIEADTYNHVEVIEKLKLFLKQNPSVTFDGAITFWEDDVPVLAKVCEEFKLPGNSYQTAVNTRNKFEMRKRLTETGLGCPEYHFVKTKRDLHKAVEEIGFPAVMKPVWGADSEFVILVQNKDEAEKTFKYLVENCTERFNPIFKYNNGAFLYEEYMEGTEVSVECFSQYGIPHVLGIHEKQPIKPPYFIEYGDIAPARIEEDIEDEVKKLAESSLIAMGVKNSLSHIEIKITTEGPKIVEVASRMGGDDIYLSVREIFEADMVEIGLMVAIGQTVKIKTVEPDNCLICRYFIPEDSGIVTKIQNLSPKSKNVLNVVINKNVGEAILVPPEGFENAGWAIVKGRTYQEAETLMNRLMERVHINVTKFKKDSLLGKTVSPFDDAAAVRNQILRASKFAKIKTVNFDALKKLNIGILTNNMENTMQVFEILKKKGYNINVFDVGEVPFPMRKIQEANLDFALNLVETKLGSNIMKAYVADFLEMLQIPYSGSNAGTLSLATDKVKVKKLLEYHQIPTPAWDYVESLDEEVSDELNFPLIVKPANSDNSFGINNNSVVTDKKQLKKQVEIMLKDFQKTALIEEYIDGEEIDVSVLGNKDDSEVLPLIKSNFSKLPKDFWHIYSSELFLPKNKQYFDMIKLEKPAKLSEKLDTLISEIALDMFDIFDCRDSVKIEMRLDKKGNPFVLELNPNPEMSEDAFMTQAAAAVGYSYDELLEEILGIAIQRYKR